MTGLKLISGKKWGWGGWGHLLLALFGVKKLFLAVIGRRDGWLVGEEQKVYLLWLKMQKKKEKKMTALICEHSCEIANFSFFATCFSLYFVTQSGFFETCLVFLVCL